MKTSTIGLSVGVLLLISALLGILSEGAVGLYLSILIPASLICMAIESLTPQQLTAKRDILNDHIRDLEAQLKQAIKERDEAVHLLNQEKKPL